MNGPPSEPAPPRSRRIALIALGLGIAAAVSCILVLSFWNSAIGPWVTVGLALAGVACGAVALEGHGHHASAISAVVLAGAAGVVAIASALPQPDLAIHVYGYKDCPMIYSAEVPADLDPEGHMTAFYVPTLVGVETSPDDPLSFGTPITVAATPADPADDLARLTAGQPVDVTAAAASSSTPAPVNGAYIAVPVTVEAVNENALSCYGYSAPPTYWFDSSGDFTEYTTVTIPDYPTIEGGGVDNGDGTYTYYEIFDIDPAAVADGGFNMDLLEPDGAFKSVYWKDAS